jgi:Glycine cleavage T-protein C-terminal barrel domain/Aminomethyltransferase folate-binding domain
MRRASATASSARTISPSRSIFPAGHGTLLWERLMQAGAEDAIAAYGIDAMNALRVEEGHVAGGELNGRVTADDLGLSRMVKPEGDFIGRRSLSRAGLNDPARWQLVGLVPADGESMLPQGAKIVDETPARYVGEVSSIAWSPMLDTPIALALVAGGRERLLASSPLAGDRALAGVLRSGRGEAACLRPQRPARLSTPWAVRQLCWATTCGCASAPKALSPTSKGRGRDRR